MIFYCDFDNVGVQQKILKSTLIKRKVLTAHFKNQFFILAVNISLWTERFDTFTVLIWNQDLLCNKKKTHGILTLYNMVPLIPPDQPVFTLSVSHFQPLSPIHPCVKSAIFSLPQPDTPSGKIWV